MSDLIPPGVIDERDIRAAQAVADAWTDYLTETGAEVSARRDLSHLRGLLAGTFSEVRAAGVLEGERAGWSRALDTAEEAVRGAIEEIR